jgi:hypothetical protein
MRLPAFVGRVGDNLEDAPLAEVLRLTSVILEFTRGLLLKAAPPELRPELDATLKPFIRELVNRAIELETHPPSRGNA